VIIRAPASSTRIAKAHQLDNLYITDASIFPSSGAVNPTLTIVAKRHAASESI